MKRNRILALLLAALLIFTLAACSASSKSVAMTDMQAPAAAESAANDENFATAAAAGDSKAAVTEDSASASAAASMQAATADSVPSAESLSKKLIYTGYVTVQTTEFDKALQALDASVDTFGGFVESSSVNGDTVRDDDGATHVVNRVAQYTVRVPADKFKSYLAQMNGLGNVISSSKSAENVTSSYTDYEAHLESLKTEQSRLTDLLAKAESVDSLVALEQRLAEVRYEIESIERSLRDLDLQIAYSTVNIELDEVEAYTPTANATRTFGQKLTDALSDGWHGFVRGLQSFCVFLAAALPTLILLAAIAAVVVLIVRAARKKRRAKAKKPEAPKQDAETGEKPAEK
jgi:hypothetical protein